MSPMQGAVCTAFYELMLEADQEMLPGEAVVFDVTNRMCEFLKGKQLVVDSQGQVVVRPQTMDPVRRGRNSTKRSQAIS